MSSTHDIQSKIKFLLSSNPNNINDIQSKIHFLISKPRDTTELLIDPITELPIDPITGLPMAPTTPLTTSTTGLPIDPITGLPMAPTTPLTTSTTGLPIDPTAGLPIAIPLKSIKPIITKPTTSPPSSTTTNLYDALIRTTDINIDGTKKIKDELFKVTDDKKMIIDIK